MGACDDSGESAKNLGFSCNGCGICCKSLRVGVTHLDLLRLCAHTGRAARDLVEFMPAAAVDMQGEPSSLVELSSGRALMTLAQRDGACRLLDANSRCSAYAARPRDCQLFPFDAEWSAHGELVRLQLLPLHGCNSDFTSALRADELRASDEQRWRELATYQTLVLGWNRLAKHRRRLQRRVGDSTELLRFLGLDA